MKAALYFPMTDRFPVLLQYWDRKVRQEEREKPIHCRIKSRRIDLRHRLIGISDVAALFFEAEIHFLVFGIMPHFFTHPTVLPSAFDGHQKDDRKLCR